MLMTKERVKEDNSFRQSKIRGNFSIWVFFFFNFENRRPLNILIVREQTEKNRGNKGISEMQVLSRMVEPGKRK